MEIVDLNMLKFALRAEMNIYLVLIKGGMIQKHNSKNNTSPMDSRTTVYAPDHCKTAKLE